MEETKVTSTPEEIDDLVYTYASNTNALVKVDDGSSGAAAQEGFVNGATSASEFFYDVYGNLNRDDNKGISTITYNVLGKPQVINFSDGRKIEYVYSASGTKLKMKTFAAGNPTPHITDYSDGFVYLGNTLAFFSSPEGRVVKTGNNYTYEYGISDHQGNTRIVFSSVSPTPDAPVATFEGDAGDDGDEYGNINPSFVNNFPTANHTPGGGKVLWMNQNYKVGPSKSLRVYPGDKVDMEVWEYHEGSSGWGTQGTPLSTLITMVSGLFGGASGGVGESGVIYNGVENAFSEFLSGGSQGDARPSAYLNFILFDKEYNVLDMGWLAAPDVSFTRQKISFPTKEIDQEGYIFVWLSYESDSDKFVSFDDFKVTHTKTNVIQYNEYYPFGLQTAESWTRESSVNNFLYNSGTELNSNSGWYETMFRGYDAALGRFMQVDPLADIANSLSPYHYGNNDPVYWNDPTGLVNDGPSRAVNGRVQPRRFWWDLIMPGTLESGFDNPNSMYYGMGGPIYGSQSYSEYRAIANSATSRGQDEFGRWGFWIDYAYGPSITTTYHYLYYCYYSLISSKADNREDGASTLLSMLLASMAISVYMQVNMFLQRTTFEPLLEGFIIFLGTIVAGVLNWMYFVKKRKHVAIVGDFADSPKHLTIVFGVFLLILPFAVFVFSGIQMGNYIRSLQ